MPGKTSKSLLAQRLDDRSSDPGAGTESPCHEASSALPASADNLRPSEICIALILSNGVGAAISVRRKSTQLNGRSGSPGVGIASLGRRQEPARENLVLGTSLVTQLFLAVFPDCRAQHKAIKGAA